MVYNPHSADLYTVGSSNEIYRLNLNLGRFQSPFVSDSPELTCTSYCAPLDLLAVGGIDGRVEFWDAQQRTKAQELLLDKVLPNQEVTSICFEPS